MTDKQYNALSILYETYPNAPMTLEKFAQQMYPHVLIRTQVIAAATYLGRLCEEKLVAKSHVKDSYFITDAGRKALKAYEAVVRENQA